MKSLIEGIERYEQQKREKYAAHFAQLAKGQTPVALFLTCADSRIVPNLFSLSAPGELFVVRNVANLVPAAHEAADDSVTSAVWYGLEVLGIRDIIVCGHSGCGGIKALRAGAPSAPLERWLSHGQSALELWRELGSNDDGLSPDDQLSQLSARMQLGNLMTYPFVSERVAEGAVRLHAWWFDIAGGRMLAYSPRAGGYVPAVETLEDSNDRRPHAISAAPQVGLVDLRE